TLYWKLFCLTMHFIQTFAQVTTDFYKLIEIKFFKKSFVSILLGMPLFYFYRMYFIKKMEEDLNKIA
ncbi:MAG: hypothetical protein P8P50_05900, partial [Flavobacteriaceae bacterium]|nr:hypothetical protein [Flavobacteriaceae bacterium]